MEINSGPLVRHRLQRKRWDSPEYYSLSYTLVDEAAKLIWRLGPQCLLAKVDIQSAYRMIPVHPEDRLLFGMVWKGNLFSDAALPFGLRSAPRIFTAVADVLEWQAKFEGITCIIHTNLRLLSFSLGSLKLTLLVSISIPKKVKCVDGPSIFSAATATDTFDLVNSANSLSKPCLHLAPPGGATIKVIQVGGRLAS